MSWGDQKNAIHAWMASATGLTTIWENEGGPRPAYPYASLRVTSDVPQGHGEERRTFVPGNPNGEQIERTFREDSVVTVSCNVFALPAGDHSLTAEAYMHKARRALVRPSFQQSLRDVGLSMAERMAMQDLSGAVNGRPLLRSQMDVQFNGVHVETPEEERGQYIEKLSGELRLEQPDETEKVVSLDIDSSGG